MEPYKQKIGKGIEEEEEVTGGDGKEVVDVRRQTTTDEIEIEI